MRIHDFSHISHILTSTERFMKKLLILLLGLLLLQISYSRSVLIPKNRPELVISKITILLQEKYWSSINARIGSTELQTPLQPLNL